YEVNLESPLVGSVLSRLDAEDAERVVGLLQTIATTFPVMDAYVEVAANVPAIATPPEREALIARLRDMHQSGLFDEAPDVAVTQLASVEPFNTIDDLYTLVDFVWKGNHATE
ncbi:MAG TPA: ATP-binding protein, partial [Candidatus Latescibacteria bacterium]|nr:ATP-binding protein [Candidatus Latescibacterota bacterium]